MPLFQQVMSENELKALLATVKTERSLVQKLKTAQDAPQAYRVGPSPANTFFLSSFC